MPIPNRWGLGSRGINVSVPDWAFDAVNQIRREHDYRSNAEAALELLVAKLLEEGVEPPEGIGPFDVGRNKRRR